MLWCNDDSGGLYLGQPHGGAYANSGVSAQGYLAIADDVLLVPTGRAVPAAFRRTDGKLLYFHLQQNTKYGGSEITVTQDLFVNGGAVFDVLTGARNSSVPPLRPNLTAVCPDRVAYWQKDHVCVSQWTNAETTDRTGNSKETTTLKETGSTPAPYGGSSLVVTGQTAVSAGGGTDGQGVCTVDFTSKQSAWSAPVDGTPWGLAVAAGRLFVSTENGTIYCFGSPTAQAPRTIKAKPVGVAQSDSDAIEKAAEQILRQTAVTGGYCLDLACGDGSLAHALAKRTNLHIYAVDSDPKNVARARQRLDTAGLYGVQITVHQGDPTRTSYPDYFANLAVSGRSTTSAALAGLEPEINRVLRPYGGTACIGPAGTMKQTVRGPLEGTGSWTHQYCDPANTNCSTDSLAKGPLGMLWFTDLNFKMPSRHGRGRAPLVSEGRLFVEGLNAVLCVDAYNGRKLWEYPLPGIQTVYDGDHLMGVSGTGGNFCLGTHGLYVHTGDRCVRLDPVTGELLTELRAPDDAKGKPGTWGIIACVGDTLFGTLANTEHVVTYRYGKGDMSTQFTESTLLFAADAETGELKWRYQPKASLRHNTIVFGNGRVHVIDRPMALGDRHREAKRGVPDAKDTQSPGTLVTLDASNGKVLWTADDDIYGTVLVLSEQHDTLLMCYQDWRFKLASELGGRLTAFDATTGERRWDVAKATYLTRPIINGRTVYLQPNAWDVLTGEQKDFTLSRSYGCGIPAGSTHLMVYRSATLGYIDLSHDYGTESYGGIRPGCWINAVPAGGLVLMPDATDRCTCSYLIKASIALAPYGVRSPAIMPPGGVFRESTTVRLTADRKDATIRYTLDGTSPTIDSAKYSVPFVIERSGTLQTRAFVDRMPPSPTKTARFTIDPNVIPLDASGWTVYDTPGAKPPDSDWQLIDGFITERSNLYLGAAGNSDHAVERPGSYRIWNDGQRRSNGELSVEIASSDNDTLGIAFRFDGPDKYYVWAMDQQRGHHVLACKNGSDYRVLAHRAAGYKPNRWYALRIVMKGPKIVVTLDGQKDLEATDNTFTQGDIALYAWGCAGAKFRGVRWKRPAATARPE